MRYMNPTQSIDEAVSVLLSEFERLMNTDDERLELESLRSKWRRINDWATRTEQFLHDEALTTNNSAIATPIERLRDALDLAKADLMLTPEALMRAAAQAARGEGIPASVLRAELEARRRS
jgi:hypothetical protein